MRNRYWFFLFPLLALFLTLSGCATQKDRIARLIEAKKYREASALLNNLSAQDRSSIQVKALQVKCTAGLLSDSASSLAKTKNFGAAVDLISRHLEQFLSYPPLQDSLRRQMVRIALVGAETLEERGDYISAYNCVEPLGDISGIVTPGQTAFLGHLTEKMLSGVWKGKSNKRKLHIEMRIDALTPSSFTGRVLFKEVYILCELQNGYFNGSELSASYPIRMGNYSPIEGVKGKYHDGSFIMSFPIVVTDTRTEDMGGGDSFTTYHSHIVQETCVMTKVKGQ